MSYLDDRLTIGLNDSRWFFKPTYWLYGDGKFARWSAKRILRSVDDPTGTIVTNKDHSQFFDRISDLDLTIYKFSVDFGERDAPWHESKVDSYLPGRWTIATTALSLSFLLGCNRAVMLGVDFSRVDGAVYTSRLDGLVEPPAKQDTMMGQWRKWFSGGFKRDFWPIETFNISDHFFEVCPDTPVKKISIRDALCL